MNNLRCVVICAVLAASGCEKPNDLPRLQDEAQATVKEYQARFDELGHRAEAISKRGNTLPPETLNSADAQRVYRQALAALEDARRNLQQVPAAIKTATASGNAEELQKLIDTLHSRLEDAVIEATWELAAVESWIDMAGHAGRPAAPAAPAADRTEPAGAAAGSDAPVQ